MGESFAQRIQFAAAAIQARPADIARAVGVSRGAVSHWYSGRSEPDGRQLVAVARFLRCDATWLAEGGARSSAGVPAAKPSDERLSTAPELARQMRQVGYIRERVGGGILGPYGVAGAAASDHVDDAEVATMALRSEAVELIRAWLALPEVERDEFKRKIETAALRWRRHVIDERLKHLAAPSAPASLTRPAIPASGRRRRGGG